ncbi:hypothetical protein VE04_07888 [Pseudogymnoascus sp. 24MN13]|nr:hypothetical protein VE04_07888 [Pseudogymnoascus sp. 24MN13]
MVKMAPPRIFVALASMIAVSRPEMINTQSTPAAPVLARALEYTANVDDVIACYNYLVALGDYTCRERDLCRIGSATISGLNRNGQIWNFGVPIVFSTAKCWDAALGLQWIFTNCNEGGKVMGYKEVGDGEYMIAATNSNIVFAMAVDTRPVDLWKSS